jgi:hypothetical protein
MKHLAVLFSVAACATNDPTPAKPIVDKHDETADACEVTCDLLRITACVGLEAEPLCDYDWLCEGICEDYPSDLICIRITPDSEVCCENYYGCQEIVTPDCSWAC